MNRKQCHHFLSYVNVSRNRLVFFQTTKKKRMIRKHKQANQINLRDKHVETNNNNNDNIIIKNTQTK